MFISVVNNVTMSFYFNIPRNIFLLTFVCVLSFSMAGCGCLNTQAKTLGEDLSGYSYIPIDPAKVNIDPAKCTITYSQIGNDSKIHKIKLLDALPDNAVRLSMELSDAKGGITYGVSKVGASGSVYKLTADYVNSDTVNKTVWIQKTVLVRVTRTLVESIKKGEIKEEIERLPIAFAESKTNTVSFGIKSADATEQHIIPGTEIYYVKTFIGPPSQQELFDLKKGKYEEYNVPIYVGIGLRAVAEGVSTSENASISGIGVVGAEAEAKRLLGSLTVQTLGVNSQAVASALPVQSELSRTTAENAFVAIGTIKAMLHQPETIKNPRVVGLYLPFPGGKALVNALISELSKTPITWCPGGYAKSDSLQPVKAIVGPQNR